MFALSPAGCTPGGGRLGSARTSRGSSCPSSRCILQEREHKEKNEANRCYNIAVPKGLKCSTNVGIERPSRGKWEHPTMPSDGLVVI